MTLSNGKDIRTESDKAIISTLIRKGWVEALKPDFNEATHQCDWVDGSWVVSELPKPPAANEIPLWAFRAILKLQGVADKVPSLIAALPEPQRTIATTQWEYGNFIRRDHPLIEVLGAQMGLNTEGIDSIFNEASALT